MVHPAKADLISVIIPCYNHATFLPQAIESVLQQTYPHREIIVVNDGSTDRTASLAAQFPNITWIDQANAGLSAARNRGVVAATGAYVVFLDADDALLPTALEQQYHHLQPSRQLAFTSGGHWVADAQLNPLEEVVPVVAPPYYEAFLQRNYVGMLAAVIFRRSVLLQFPFDETLKGCEDYDLYLRIAAKHEVSAHTDAVSLYRSLAGSMSANLPVMLEQVLKVLDRQKQMVRTKAQKKALAQGRRNWIDLYCYEMFYQLRQNKVSCSRTKEAYRSVLKRYKPRLYLRYLLTTIISPSNILLKGTLHSFCCGLCTVLD